jgi:serine phosphatase RsbU (regulator of sigma subunit)
MFRKIPFILLLFVNQLSFCQVADSKIDSLKHVLQNAKDIDKIAIYIELSDIKIFEEDGLSYAKQAYELAKKIKDIKAQADALNAMGKVFYAQYQEDKALDCFIQSLSFSEKVNDLNLMGKNLRSIGQAYYAIDSIDKFKLYTNKALELSRRINDRLLEADALIDMGTLKTLEGNPDSALILLKQALNIRLEENAMLDVAHAYNRLGRLYDDIGETKNAIESYQKEIEIKESQSDFAGLYLAYYNLGRVHYRLGNYQLALEQFQNSLIIAERIKHQYYIAIACNEIGIIYENLSQSALSVDDNEVHFRKALEFHERALSLFKLDENLAMVARSLNNIANTNSRLAINSFVAMYGEAWEDSLYKIPSNDILLSFSKTIDNYNQALEIFEQIEDDIEIAKVYINLGSHYNWVRNWTQAQDFINKGLGLAKKLNSRQEISNALFALGETNFRKGNLNQAERYFFESASIAEELGLIDDLRHSYNKLSKIYEQQGEMTNALVYYKKSTQIKDLIFSEKSQKAITEMQTKYETEKKEQEIKLLSNEKALLNSENQRQRLVIFITIGGLLVILAFAGLLINMVRQKQRANKILEEKNELISHQKQEITDSIRYASRIQNAILPSENLLNTALKEHFVLFLPRDIVSGDFYWFTKKDNKMVLVAADCTGHGVPGAFMSMLGVSFLYEIVNKEGIMQPAKILNMLRELVKVTLSQTGKQNEQKDGMDISLSLLDLNNMHLEWAGAYNPLYLIRNGELIEYKADKMPVAIHINDDKPFTNNEIDLKPGDTFYMFSDGFPDQFGGQEGRKFMSKRFKELLVEINHLTMDEQKNTLHQAHLKWREGYEQIDDVVIFGVRV